MAWRGAASDGRAVRATLRLPHADALLLELEAERMPLRLGVDWVGRPGVRFTGLGPRHAVGDAAFLVCRERVRKKPIFNSGDSRC